jgi:hypothetical protein
MAGERWENCVAHYDAEVLRFFEEYFKNDDRKCLLIGGAGFDPRSTALVKSLSQILATRLNVYLIREERPDPDPELVRRADLNIKEIEEYCENVTVVPVDIFAADNAVVGGRNVVSAIKEIKYSEYTDIVVDASALSMGISYPVVSFVFELACDHFGTMLNVHLVVMSNPELDALITSEPNERASDVHGFMRRELFGDSEKARLWLPLLSEGRELVLKMIHGAISPQDTCPILPFPSVDAKKGDRVAFDVFASIQSDWGGPLENDWGLDPRNFVYADERRPLDIYRTILRIDEERTPVFEALGGSIVILSPLGSKIPAIGALMAALERKFPVVYVEALAYTVNWERVDASNSSDSRMVHIWLYGDAYFKDIEAKNVFINP